MPVCKYFGTLRIAEILFIPALVAFFITYLVVQATGSTYVGIVTLLACLVGAWVIFDRIPLEPLKKNNKHANRSSIKR